MLNVFWTSMVAPLSYAYTNSKRPAVLSGGPLPGQQFVEPAGRVISDAGNDVGEIGFGIEAVELGGLGQGVEDSGALAALG